MQIYKIEIADKDIDNYVFYIDETQPSRPYGLLDDQGKLVALGNLSKYDIKEILDKLIKLDSVENVWEFVDGDYVKKNLW